MVFKSDKQRKGFFARGTNTRTSTNPNIITDSKRTAFSYRDGRNLGKFNSLQEVFKKFPSEKKAFNRVMTFRRQSGVQVNSIREIKMVQRAKKTSNPNPRWDKK